MHPRSVLTLASFILQIVVNEDLIALSILRLVEVEKNVVEGAGAAGVAAVLSGQMDDFKGKR